MPLIRYFLPRVGQASSLVSYFVVDTAAELPAANEGDLAYANDTNRLYVRTGSAWSAVGGASTFVGLSDTPGSYAGEGFKFVRVNGDENGLEFVAPTEPDFGEALVAFSGDPVRRVTVGDPRVSAGDGVLVSVVRPNTASDADDPGWIYTANVVRVAEGEFDVLIAALGWGLADATAVGPNETIRLIYSVVRFSE